MYGTVWLRNWKIQKEEEPEELVRLDCILFSCTDRQCNKSETEMLFLCSLKLLYGDGTRSQTAAVMWVWGWRVELLSLPPPLCLFACSHRGVTTQRSWCTKIVFTSCFDSGNELCTDRWRSLFQSQREAFARFNSVLFPSLFRGISGLFQLDPSKRDL